MGYKILEIDHLLKPYEKQIDVRMSKYKEKKKKLLKKGETLVDVANGYHYFGIHKIRGGWVYREWAPSAEAMYFTGDFNDWNQTSHPMNYLGDGVFEIVLKGAKALWNGCKVKAIVKHNGQLLERIPTYATYVVQDSNTYEWNATIWNPRKPFVWSDEDFKRETIPYIYECHIGMAQEKYGVGTYVEFKENVLPRVKELGYNTLQIMAIMEHPYYGSFGYQVSNFFAPSSRFGTPDELKDLINTAHNMGIAVLLDVVHSHAVKNTYEGLSEFDGTPYQYFHDGEKGIHRDWDTRLFDYGKHEVIHFLLSNLKYWMEEFHFDGFRFDGVTSMIYHNHGIGECFDHYDKYYSDNVDVDALIYLQLANELIHKLNKKAITIAEDMSGMPGMCLPISKGGIGFDYRLAMGVADLWIKYLKHIPDEYWDIWNLWYELTSRRPQEKVIGYVESHDQALVGDKTVMFRLCDKELYWSMEKDAENVIIDRGIALHKIIRLLTHSLVGDGYLNFMGNEFGHPEWIDFPREGNGWSYQYCRRQWSLVDRSDLKYEWLNEFDKAMIQMSKKTRLFSKHEVYNLWVHQGDKVLAYERNQMTFIYNIHPTASFSGYFIPVSKEGVYQVILSTDDSIYGGQDRISKTYEYHTEKLPDGRVGFLIYLPSRTGMVLKYKGK